MAKIDIQQLKSKGLTCSKLKGMEKKQLSDASKFRKVGFENIAKQEEQIARKIKGLRKRVCLLR